MMLVIRCEQWCVKPRGRRDNASVTAILSANVVWSTIHLAPEEEKRRVGGFCENKGQTNKCKKRSYWGRNVFWSVHVMHGVRVCRDYEPGFQFQKRADATARTLRHILSNRRVYTPEQILSFYPLNYIYSRLSRECDGSVRADAKFFFHGNDTGMNEWINDKRHLVSEKKKIQILILCPCYWSLMVTDLRGAWLHCRSVSSSAPSSVLYTPVDPFTLTCLGQYCRHAPCYEQDTADKADLHE